MGAKRRLDLLPILRSILPYLRPSLGVPEAYEWRSEFEILEEGALSKFGKFMYL